MLWQQQQQAEAINAWFLIVCSSMPFRYRHHKAHNKRIVKLVFSVLFTDSISRVINSWAWYRYAGMRKRSGSNRHRFPGVIFYLEGTKSFIERSNSVVNILESYQQFMHIGKVISTTSVCLTLSGCWWKSDDKNPERYFVWTGRKKKIHEK